MFSEKEEAELLTQYYLNQAGYGGVIFDGAIYQKGYGIGSFFSGLFRNVLPILKETGITFGRELVKGANSLLDVFDPKKPTQLTKNIVKEGAKSLIENLKNNQEPLGKITGSGYKRLNGKKKKGHSRKKTGKSKSKRQKQKKKKSKNKTAVKSGKVSKRKTKKQKTSTLKKRKENINKIRSLINLAKKPSTLVSQQPDYFSSLN